MKVVVLMGGMSREREISLRSGRAVGAALRRNGHDVIDVDAGPDLAGRLAQIRPDAVFVALHGRYGEDGCVQGLLEIMGIPYTGSGVAASAIGMDKVLTKRIAAAAGVTVAPDLVWTKGDDVEALCRSWSHGWPAIIKPSREGSSLGLTLAHTTQEMRQGLAAAARHDDQVIVEAYIRGREVTVGLLDGNPMPTLEVIPASGLYDYQAKYTQGATTYQVPAEIPPAANTLLQEASRTIWRVLDLSGFARADFMLPIAVRGNDSDANVLLPPDNPRARTGTARSSLADNRPVFLEINTIPGFTELSLVPKAAAAIGIGFDALVERILKTASLKLNQEIH